MVWKKIFSTAFFVGIVLNTILCSFFLFFKALVTFWRDRRITYQEVARVWGKLNLKLAWSSVEVIGKEHIDYQKNYLVLSNHSSSFDISVLLASLGLNCIFISKRKNFDIIFLGKVIEKMGCIPINRGDKKEALKSIQAAAVAYQHGQNIILFPEGTRSETGEVNRFKSGFLHIIKDSAAHLLPVSISGTHRLQPSKSFLVTPSKLRVVIGRPIRVEKGEVNELKRKMEIVDQIESFVRENHISNFGG